MLNLQSTPNPFTNSTVSFGTKFLPLSDTMTDEQPRLLRNRLKVFMNEVESICGTTSSITPRVPAHVYKVTHTLKSVELSLAKILYQCLRLKQLGMFGNGEEYQISMGSVVDPCRDSH